jgi:predicted O-linked N-acetylglucosamine transferase (SPINDLY family)
MTQSAIDQLIDQALSHHRAGRTAEAEALYRQALALDPADPDGLHLLGMLKAGTGDMATAVELIGQAIKHRPDDERFHLNLGNLLRQLGRADEALASFTRALAIKADTPEAHFNRAITLAGLDRFSDALASFDAGLALNAGQPGVWRSRGLVLVSMGRDKDAADSFIRAVQLDPSDAESHYSLGMTLAGLRRHEEAAGSFTTMLALQPDHAEARNDLGVALMELNRPTEALESYSRAVAARPDWADPLINRGHALCGLKRYAEGLADYRRAMTLKPGADLLPGAVLNTQLHICDWASLDAATADVLARVERNDYAVSPFALLSLPATRAQQKQAASRHAATFTGPVAPFTASDGKIRIAYVSPDFHTHPVAHLIAGMLEQHDRAKFEVIGLSFGTGRAEDPMRRRIQSACDRSIEIRNMSDDDALSLSREINIDIAVDLAGYTANARTGLFARRLAPVQVNYLGSPATMGLATMDYIIADATVIPDAHGADYSEKRVILPNSFQVNDTKRVIGPLPTRAKAGLPEKGVVFCSFNAPYKFNPTFFTIWLRLLRGIEKSVLWLIAESDEQIKNLRAFAASQSIDPARLIFAGRAPYPDHLARYACADLVLDTLPFNGGATTSDALWAGAPVLTCMGDTYVGRMAASLLRAVGLPELVTESPADYEARALDLARTPAQLSALRVRLAQNRLTTPLFDTRLFTRHIEAAYSRMHQLYKSGQKPVDIIITG